ncbi:MAG: cell division protein ZapA [Rubricoccaceae bacterium]
MPAPGPASRSIRVRVLERDYPLRVAPADEAYMQHLARYVDERLRSIRRGLPAQPDLTHAVLGALQLAEELFAARAEIDRLQALVEQEADALAGRLERLLPPETPPSGDGHAGPVPARGDG